MSIPEKFKGVFPAFYACYDSNGNVSHERTSRLAQFYYSLGIPGLYVAGSSGECVYQTVEERKAILEAVMDAVGGRMTIIAHIAAPSTQDSIILAQHAEKYHADAIAMIPGIYYGLSDQIVKNYWCDVLDATDQIPLFIYNIPVTVNGYNLSTDLFTQMLETKRIAGIKNSSGSVADIMRFRLAGGDDIAIFNGADEQYLGARMMGASGGIGGTYGYMPELYLKLENYIRKAEFEKAYALQKQLFALINFTFHTKSLYAAAKEVLRLRGLDVGSVRPPFLPLSGDEFIIIQALYEKIQEVNNNF